MKTKLSSHFAFACALAISAAHAQAQTAAPVKVTPDTYIRAETDRQFAEIVKMAGGVNRFYHWLAVLALMILSIGGLWIAIGASLRHGFPGRITSAVVYRMSALALTLLAGAVSAHAFM
jgi:hypothetical protein